jgi:spore germination cell wall hydrolase CwlJ-like protein
MPRRVELGSAAPLAVLSMTLLGGCAGLSPFHSMLSERECMTRVMYFESNRSSDEGMLAVGTVVMNRLESGRYPHTVCGVVGQPGQFAPGALTLPMRPDEAARARVIADAVLHGARHPGVGKAMFFHTAGYYFPYSNMHYVLVAGGNAFYEKVPTERLVAMRRSRPRTIGDMIARLFSGVVHL